MTDVVMRARFHARRRGGSKASNAVPELVVFVLVLTLAGFVVDAAHAQQRTGGWERGVEAEAVVRDGGLDSALEVVRGRGSDSPNDGGATPVSSGGGPACVAEPLTSRFEDHGRFAYIQGQPDWVFYWRVCDGEPTLDWYVPGDTPPEELTGEAAVAVLVDEAVARLQPPSPVLVTSPPSDTQALTGLPTYLAVDDSAYASLTSEVSAGGITVTATLTPIGTRFDPGDDTGTIDCDGPGAVWQRGDAAAPGPDDCTHTYTHTPAHLSGDADAATFELSAEVVYAAAYTVTGALTGGTFELGELTSPVGSLDLPVIERRAVRVAP